MRDEEAIIALLRARLNQYGLEETIERLNSYGQQGPTIEEFFNDEYFSEFFCHYNFSEKSIYSLAIIVANDDHYLVDTADIQYSMAA